MLMREDIDMMKIATRAIDATRYAPVAALLPLPPALTGDERHDNIRLSLMIYRR